MMCACRYINRVKPRFSKAQRRQSEDPWSVYSRRLNRQHEGLGRRVEQLKAKPPPTGDSVPASPVYTRRSIAPPMLTNEDLAALLPRVALGDRAAFERVYRAACAHLLGVAFRILNSRERAEEVLQEAFMNVWHAAGGFDASVAGPMTWLVNIVRNKAIDALRSGRTERASTLAFDEEAMAGAADPTLQPPALLERSLEKLRITRCMGELGAPQRQALALAYYRGMVHTEIAETLGAPLGTVKAWVRRGRDTVKHCLVPAGLARKIISPSGSPRPRPRTRPGRAPGSRAR